MAIEKKFDYKLETDRYRYYYQRLYRFYQKPIAQVSTAILFTLVTIIFFAVFAVKPTLETIAELMRKIKDQQQVLELAQKKSAALVTAQEQLNAINPSLTTLAAAIPNGYDLQSLLTQLEAIAGQLGIPITSLSMSDIQFPPAANPQSTVQEMTFTLSLETTYPLARSYLDALHTLPRFIKIETVSFSQKDKDSTPTDSGGAVVQTSIGCRTYYVTPTSK